MITKFKKNIKWLCDYNGDYVTPWGASILVILITLSFLERMQTGKEETHLQRTYIWTDRQVESYNPYILFAKREANEFTDISIVGRMAFQREQTFLPFFLTYAITPIWTLLTAELIQKKENHRLLKSINLGFRYVNYIFYWTILDFFFRFPS